MTRIVLSAVALELRFLPGTMIFFIPAYLVLLFISVHPLQRRMGIPMWITTSFSLCRSTCYMRRFRTSFSQRSLLGGTGSM